MGCLRVENFSCIDDATLNFGRLTILIGPQASGKSVLSKLIYFFHNILAEQSTSIDEAQSFEQFASHIKDQFATWFPASAWGVKPFIITYQAGDYHVRITRIKSKSPPHGKLRLTFSSYFQEQYLDTTNWVSLAKKKKKASSDPTANFELIWSAREYARRAFTRKLGSEYFSEQYFIPAGRAFFTSLGKAIVAFEQGNMLDPATLNFGRILTSVREYAMYNRYRTSRRSKVLTQKAMQILFGGKLTLERNKEHFETEDGRKIPFTALSSGQQELLPLWLVLETITERPGGSRQLIYIEEPEAHLFPSAQSYVVEILATLVTTGRIPPNMIITTHSPYVLAKINNLIKAGQLAKKIGSEGSKKIARIISSAAWLETGMVKAYAIIDRKLHSIIEPDGFVNGDYLDDVSGEIAKEFSSLLEIEIEHEPIQVSKRFTRSENQIRGGEVESNIPEPKS